ncbi:MAG: hypothetical protein ABJF89_00530 [Parasphingorhabdus sp.]|uniref:hypothetical protein n=1 Tax=Parasphingorhabdus sp. TaxID=2709688 RepID=UPI0032654E48
MALTTRTHSKGSKRIAVALALSIPALSIATLATAPEAHAQVTAKRVNGIYQSTSDRSLINEFKMDIFGGLEITPIRQGKRYKKVIYRKKGQKGSGVWEEVGAFKKDRATYTYKNSGALVWQKGNRKITLVRTGHEPVTEETVDKFNLSGTFVFANNRQNQNVFSMNGRDKVSVTPYRKGKSGRRVFYHRISDSEFKDDNGSGVYTVLPNGNLLWESRDNRKIRMNLTRK